MNGTAFRLVDSGWSTELTEAVRADGSSLRIVCPFIKTEAVERLLALRPRDIQVLTRFSLQDFADGVSDVAALRRLLAAGGTVRGIRNLHSKLYLFGSSRAIITSANLTSAALDRNQEFGVVSQDSASVAICAAYFNRLWSRGGNALSRNDLDLWDEVLIRHRLSGGRTGIRAKLPDFGANAGLFASPPIDLPLIVSDAHQAFVKFLGEGRNRVPSTFEVEEEIRLAGCHWAVAYPASKRPSGVHDGALMFIARLTREPNDIRVFGRAIGLKHEPGRDDATPDDIELRPWKATWSRYVRVHHAEFVAGTMANGVSLNELMEALGADSFVSTQRNAASGNGKNTEPRRAYLQQPAVELSNEGLAWLGERLQAAFAEHGTVPGDVLDRPDWPPAP